MRRTLTAAIGTGLALAVMALAQDKVPLGAPDAPAAAAGPDAGGDLIARLQNLPDGVLRVQTNADGSFKSLVVKAAVGIDDVLGAAKARETARVEAETDCKKYLAKWLGENCEFVESRDSTVQLTTRGEAAKDAAGNTVRLHKQEGTETKVLTEHSRSVASAFVQGLTVLQSQVTAGAGPQYVLVMGLSQKHLDESRAVRRALARPDGQTPDPAKAAGAEAGPADLPAPETRTNPEAKEF